MGLADDALKRPSTTRVNRSMTRGELVLQMALNSQLGRSGALLSNPLCEQLTDVEPDVVRPSVAVQEQLWHTLSDAVARVNVPCS